MPEFFSQQFTPDMRVLLCRSGFLKKKKLLYLSWTGFTNGFFPLASLILADAEVEITAEKLLTLVNAAGLQEVEPIWVQLYAKALAGQNLLELMTAFSAGGAAAGGAAAGAAAGGAAAEEEAVEEEASAAEESDDDMGLGLFD